MTSETSQSELQIARKVLGKTLVLTLDGRAEPACVDQLEDALNEISAMRPQHVLIDLTQLEEIADLVNGTLSMFANSVRNNGGDVRFVVQPMRRSA